MQHLGSAIALVVAALCFQTAPPNYSRDVAKWEEVTPPPETDRDARSVWETAANRSKFEWRVFSIDGRVQAQLDSEATAPPPKWPTFKLAAGEFSTPEDKKVSVACEEVDDGWLVGFDRGEFGGALYWFSKDGTRNVKVSDDPVRAFFKLPDGLYAIEGLAHLSILKGSIIRIAKPDTGAPWRATKVIELHDAPRAVSLTKAGRVLLVLAHSLVSIDSDWTVRTLIAPAPWDIGLYPQSCVLSGDEKRLYVGMRQYVAEIDLATNGVRLLIPAMAFVNQLPDETQQRILDQSER